jgi:hypothetical protein
MAATPRDPRTDPKPGDTKTYDDGFVYVVDSIAPFRYSLHEPERLPNVGGTTPAEWAASYGLATWAAGVPHAP